MTSDDAAYDDLPAGEFAFPGPLRDRLVAAILDSSKTSTTALAAGYELDGEPLPKPGDREAVLDSAGRRVAVIETVDVQVLRLADVTLDHALAEGEGHRTVAEWRAGHETFWHSPQVREELGETFTVNDDTQVVTQTFRLITKL